MWCLRALYLLDCVWNIPSPHRVKGRPEKTPPSPLGQWVVGVPIWVGHRGQQPRAGISTTKLKLPFNKLTPEATTVPKRLSCSSVYVLVSFGIAFRSSSWQRKTSLLGKGTQSIINKFGFGVGGEGGGHLRPKNLNKLDYFQKSNLQPKDISKIGGQLEHSHPKCYWKRQD